MPQRLLLRMLPGEPEAEWALAPAAGAPVGPVRTGALSAAASAARGHRVTVLVPGEDVLLLRAKVPTRKRSRLLQALPYALEDELAAGVDTLHCAAGPLEPDGTVATAVVAHQRLRQWLERLAAAGIEPVAVIPETLAPPLAADAWSVAVEGDRAWVRTGLRQGFAADLDNLAPLLRRALREARDDAPTRLRACLCRGAPRSGLEPALAAAGLPFDLETRASLLEFTAAAPAGTEAINLLQGHYSPGQQLGDFWRTWRAAAVLLVLWGATQMGIDGVHAWRLERSRAALESQAQTAFFEMFPDARRAVNVRAQTEDRLRRLRADGRGATFLATLEQASRVLARTPAVTVTGLSFRNRQLDLDVTTDTVEALERAKQELAGTGLGAELVSAQAGADGVRGRLRVSGAGS